MIIMLNSPSETELQRVMDKLRQSGLMPHAIRSEDKMIVAAVGDTRAIEMEQLERWPGVEKVIAVQTPFKLVSRSFSARDSVVEVEGVRFGGGEIPVIAGPCAVESHGAYLAAAKEAKAAGAVMLRGGAYKPRTSPYSFQGLQEEGLEVLRAARQETGLPVVTEVTDPRMVGKTAEAVAMLQIGARNMQNYELLKEVAASGRPVMLKRGPAATVEEWLMAAEYLAAGGNPNIVLCERGIRTFETYTRYTLDINAVAVAKRLSHLPVIVDPSHGTGRWELVGAASRAALAAGADGLMIEVHPEPEEAMSDGPQSLTPANFAQLMKSLGRVAEAVDRSLARPDDRIRIQG